MRDVTGSEIGDAGLSNRTLTNFSTAEGNQGVYLLGHCAVTIEWNNVSGYTGDGLASHSYGEVVISANRLTGAGRAAGTGGHGA